MIKISEKGLVKINKLYEIFCEKENNAKNHLIKSVHDPWTIGDHLTLLGVFNFNARVVMGI